MWFKLNWLNSPEREDYVKELEQELSNVRAQLSQKEVLQDKPYRNIYFSNGNITVVFKDGSNISKSDVSHQLFESVRNAQTEFEIIGLLTKQDNSVDEATETKEERDLVSQNLGILIKHPDFEIHGEQVYLKGVNLAMPAIVVSNFIEILEKLNRFQKMSSSREEDYIAQYYALKMFWLKLALNPLPQSRADMLTFVRKNNVRITNNGNLILYRRIVTKAGADTKMVTFISQNYYRLKKAGEDTRNYAVGKNDDGYFLFDLTKGVSQNDAKSLITNLQTAYLELPNMDTNTFTASHDRSVTIKIGGVYSIPEDKINLNNSICAAGGLHAAAVDYDYSGFGDLPVVVLVNPSKAITVPLRETGKLRTTEMFVACVNDKPHGVHFDDNALAAFDHEYHDLTLTQLEEAAKSKSFEGLSIKDNVPAVSLVDLKTIKDLLDKRIVNII